LRRPAAAGSYRSALRSTDLRKLMAGITVSATGSWAYNVALAVLLYERTHSPSWVAAGTLCRFVPAILFSPYAGVIAERFERVMLMVRLDLIASALQVVLAILAGRRGPLVAILVVVALAGQVQTVYTPAAAAVIPQVVDEDDLTAANALNAAIENLVVILGPAVGAVLLVLDGVTFTIIVNAASFAASAAIVASMQTRSTPSDVTRGGSAGVVRQITEGFDAVVGSPTVAAFVAFCAMASFVYGTDTVVLVPVAHIKLGMGTSGYGYLLAGQGMGGVAGALVVNRLASRRRLATAILAGMCLYCLPNALLIAVHRPSVGFALQVVRGAGTLVVDTLAITALQRSVPKEMVARVFGVFFALVLASISLGALVAPLLLRAGLDLTLLLIGLGVPAASLALFPYLTRIDRVAARRAAGLEPEVALLERLGLFSTASRPSLERLAEAARRLDVQAGTAVVSEGDESDAFFVVERGELTVSARGEAGGPPVFLRTLGPGTYFGEIGLIGRRRRTATVTADAPCALLCISGRDFLDALSDLNASPSLLEGARTRLALTHPSGRRGLTSPASPDGDGDLLQ